MGKGAKEGKDDTMNDSQTEVGPSYEEKLKFVSCIAKPMRASVSKSCHGCAYKSVASVCAPSGAFAASPVSEKTPLLVSRPT